jgi:hypothetical protein
VPEGGPVLESTQLRPQQVSEPSVLTPQTQPSPTPMDAKVPSGGGTAPYQQTRVPSVLTAHGLSFPTLTELNVPEGGVKSCVATPAPQQASAPSV